MSAPIPSIEPLIFTQGDSVSWTKSLSDYPATSWTLAYFLNGPSKKTVTAAASGTDYSISISASDSGSILPGRYAVRGYVTSGSERHEVYSGTLVVAENPSAIEEGRDLRTHARICLDAIEAVLEGRATRDEIKYVMAATSAEVEKIPHEQLLKFRDYYLAEVAREEAAELVNRGESPQKNIGIRFRNAW